MPRKSRIAVPAALFLALSACTSHAAEPDRPLKAALTTPTDIDLVWHDDRPGVAGHVLEFATEADGPYTVLKYLPRQVSTYRHPDLIPHTTFHYRLRSYRGPTSEPTRVDRTESIRFTWTDESADEDGFLLEIRRKGGGTRYEPLAVLDPDVTFTELATLPGEKDASFQVRAFVLGEQSNVVRLTTGE
ncbi:fibronectin type III domain-containing protein [Streptomyces sp. NPDC051954]|uniref:fibronectin type III domain-containing protein n=1 Tax=Streptomyces sp. NPDC051954 TaxID=3155524 RepID=UPI003419BE5D